MKSLLFPLVMLCAISRAQTPCSAAKLEEITGEASRSLDSVLVDCSFTLPAGSKPLTKRLIFKGGFSSNVAVDCAGGTINGGRGLVVDIHSDKYYSTRLHKWRFERPENIRITRCNIIGSVRVWGMSKSGEGFDSATPEGVNLMKESSRHEGHTVRVQDAAPTNIIFDRVTITSTDRIPLYISPGVTHFQLLHSVVKGSSSEMAIYLDAESAYNTFRNNRIFTTTTRELIAIDGSSHNVFMNNWFSSLNHGGLFLYRNCGQNGVSRHASPIDNRIINNVFFYDTYSGPDPAVFLGARSGRKPYCGADDHSQFGSGASDLDYARFNIVMQNQIYKRPHKDMIRTALRISEVWPHVDWVRANSPNYIDYNETVNAEKSRLAGCYVSFSGSPKDFVVDGQTIEVLEFPGGRPVSYNYRCSDGELTRTSQNSPVSEVAINYHISGSNARQEVPVLCPAGQRVLAVRAACNLESVNLTSADLMSVPPNAIVVLKASDHVAQGSCWINGNEVRTGRIRVKNIDGLRQVQAGCREHDDNGGDCQIKGILYCR